MIYQLEHFGEALIRFNIWTGSTWLFAGGNWHKIQEVK